VTSTEPLVEVPTQLSLDGLMGLIDRRILALRIPGYYPTDDAARTSQLIISGYGPEGIGGAECYETGGVGGGKRLGIPFFDTRLHPELLDEYYAEALPAQRRLRQIFAPFLSPIDKLRLELQEIWPYGALPENLTGRNLFIGLGRVFEKDVDGAPHQDILRRDTPEAKARTIQAQLGSNIYLQCPSTGGELEIWHLYFADDECEQYIAPGSHGIDRSRLPAPTVVIKPEPGDLILFNSESLHAVTAVNAETRVSISSFIGYRGIDAPLTMWS
jgi:hypothetical protein